MEILEGVCVSVSCSVVSDSLWPHGLQSSRLLCPRNSPGKNIGVGCISFSNANFSSNGLVAKSCPTLATPQAVACQVPLSMGFSRLEYWSGLPFPSPILEGRLRLRVLERIQCLLTLIKILLMKKLYAAYLQIKFNQASCLFFLTLVIRTQTLLLFSCSAVSDSLQPHGGQHTRLCLAFAISWSLLKLISIKSVIIQPSHPLSSPFPPASSLSQHQVH